MMPIITLHEKTEVMSHSAVREGHLERLRKYRHVRYMWVPFTKYCAVVTSNPVADAETNVLTLRLVGAYSNGTSYATMNGCSCWATSFFFLSVFKRSRKFCRAIAVFGEG